MRQADRLGGVDRREQLRTEPGGMTDAEAPRGPQSDHAFAHASEAEFARILDFYQVAWEYEPQVFPILWDLDGNVLESFAPDFYLPELDLFVELTTLQQRLVRKKNRKVRRLRELYPGLRIKLFYARDFRALMLKYGRAALVSELSGTLGQVMPARTRTDRRAPSRSGGGSDADRLDAIDRVRPSPARPRSRAAGTRPPLARRPSSRRRPAAAVRRPAHPSRDVRGSDESLPGPRLGRRRGAAHRGADRRPRWPSSAQRISADYAGPRADARQRAQGFAAVHGGPDAAASLCRCGST